VPDVGVLDLRFARDVGLDCGRAEVDVLRSFGSAWSEDPLANETGGDLLDVLVAGFVGVVFTVFGGGDLVPTKDGPGLVAGGLAVGWDVSGASMGSGSTRVGFREGGVTSITFGGSAGGEGALSTSGGVPGSESLASGGVGVFFNSENGEARMIGWTGGHRWPGVSPEGCTLGRGGHSLPPTLLSFGGELTLEARGGHSLLSLISSLVESPVM